MSASKAEDRGESPRRSERGMVVQLEEYLPSKQKIGVQIPATPRMGE